MSTTGRALGFLRFAKQSGSERRKLPQMGQLISSRWVAARDEILARAKAEPQIRYEQFAEVCQRHDVSREETLTLAELMHDLGHVIYYGEDEGLKDVVILDPEWLTKAISYVLEDKPTAEAAASSIMLASGPSGRNGAMDDRIRPTTISTSCG